MHGVNQFNQKAWLRPYTDINTKLRKEAKSEFVKDFKLKGNSVFGKSVEKVKKHRDIKLAITDKRRKQLVSEPNYHTTKWFEDLLAVERNKSKNEYSSVFRSANIIY